VLKTKPIFDIRISTPHGDGDGVADHRVEVVLGNELGRKGMGKHTFEVKN
jgi:hypothetical protein